MLQAARALNSILLRYPNEMLLKEKHESAPIDTTVYEWEPPVEPRIPQNLPFSGLVKIPVDSCLRSDDGRAVWKGPGQQAILIEAIMSVLHPPSPISRADAPLPLENGDRLTRVEFERRYEAMPELKKAELVGGIVYMSSPVRHRAHGKLHVILSGWLAYYLAKTPGIEPSDNATVRLDDDNEPQPDLLLRWPVAIGGGSKVAADDYIEGPVEWVAEIASSTASLDMHAKLETYRQHGIGEYLIWRVRESAVDWFSLRDGRYDPLKADSEGILRSALFPGLWLDPAALIRCDLRRLFEILDAGMATPEHARFVERLASVE